MPSFAAGATPDTPPPRSIREQILLGWAGACPCDLEAAAPIRPGVLCDLTGDGLPADAEGLVVDPTGTVLIASHRFLEVIDDDGTRARLEANEMPEDFHGVSAAIFSGTAEAGRARYLFATHQSTLDDRVDILRLFAARREPNRRIVVEALPSGVAGNFLPKVVSEVDPDGSLYIAGAERGPFNSSTAKLLRCTLDPADRITCGVIPVDHRDCETGRALDRLTRLTSSVAVGLTADLRLYFRPLGGALWSCLGSIPPRSLGAGEMFYPEQLTDAAHIGNRLFVCGSGRVGTSPAAPLRRGAVWTAEIPATASVIELAQLRWSSIELDDSCDRLTILPDRDDRVRAFYGDGPTLDLDASGQIVERHAQHREVYPEIPQPIAAMRTFGDFAAATTESGAVYVQRPGERFRHVYGPVSDDPRATGGLVALPDQSIAALDPRRGLTRISAVSGVTECGAIEAETSTGATFLSAGQIPETAALSVDGGLIVTGRSPAGVWLKRLALDPVRVQSELSLAPEPDSRWLSAIELAADTRILLTRDGRVFAEISGRVRAIEVSFDDPSTPTVEEAPLLLPDRGGPWRAIAQAHGVAWLGGDDVVGRIIRTGPDSFRAEGYWLSRFRAGPFSALTRRAAPMFTAVHALCPDDVAFATSERFDEVGMADEPYVGSWRTAPGDRGCGAQSPAPPAAAPLVLCEVERGLRQAAPGGSIPVAIVGSGATLTVVTSSRRQALLRSSGIEEDLPFSAIDGAATDRFLAVRDVYGRLFALPWLVVR